MVLTVLPERLVICRLGPRARVPAWAGRGSFSSITRTPDELSVICRAGNAPAGVQQESGWRALKVEGPLAFSEVGVLAALARPLAAAGVPILVIGTYDTDYILVRESRLPDAVAALQHSGHEVRELKAGAM